MKKRDKFPYVANPTAIGLHGTPDDCFEMVNRYGTYNIQPTADADNAFPAIAQGMPRGLCEEEKK